MRRMLGARIWVNLLIISSLESLSTSDQTCESDHLGFSSGVLPACTDTVSLSYTPPSFRLNIWTQQAPSDPNEPSPLLERILKIGRHFKKDVLNYELDHKLLQSGFSTEVEFIGHKDGERKNKAKKIVLN